MRKLARSFFWIDQELIRSGLWLKLSKIAKLIYVSLASSVSREGVSLWGARKLMALADCSDQEWEDGLKELSDYNLVALPPEGELGIFLLSLSGSQKTEMTVSGAPYKKKPLPDSMILKTITTVEMSRNDAES